MMTKQLEISILAAPLAAIDRRVLSQAWYSALRLVREESSSFSVPSRRQRSAFAGPSPVYRREPRTYLRGLPARPVDGAEKRSPAFCGDAEASSARRRAPRSRARAIESTMRGPSYDFKRATFSIGRGSARVHVVLQTKGGRTTLVALCRPELREFVARALAQARLALAARGIDAQLAAKGVGQCS